LICVVPWLGAFLVPTLCRYNFVIARMWSLPNRRRLLCGLFAFHATVARNRGRVRYCKEMLDLWNIQPAQSESRSRWRSIWWR